MVNWPKTIAISDLDKLRIECAHDQALRNRMIADPNAVLAERGIEVPPNLKVNIVADSPDSYTLTLPPYVGSDLASDLSTKSSANPTWWCTTCTTTSPICIGSLASLTCIA